MATPIKEFKAFFLRAVQKSSGTDADQETNFNIQYFVNGVLKFNRFLKNHFPSENVFKKLFESITFKLEVGDTATFTTQGLVEKATDGEVLAGTDNSTVIGKENLYEIEKLISLLDELGVYSIGFSEKLPRNNHTINYNFINEEIKRIIEKNLYTIKLIYPKGYRNNVCKTNGKTLLIDPEGKIYPCPVSDFVMSNILDIKKIGENDFSNYHNLNIINHCHSFSHKCPTSL